MTSMVSKVLGGQGTLARCAGPTCCKRSSCWKIPGLGCRNDRGSTTCVGASLLPPRRGVCSCSTGACSTIGKCETPAQSSYPRLYALEGPLSGYHPQDVSP